MKTLVKKYLKYEKLKTKIIKMNSMVNVVKIKLLEAYIQGDTKT